jgi:pristinamycin I synthase-3/4
MTIEEQVRQFSQKKAALLRVLLDKKNDRVFKAPLLKQVRGAVVPLSHAQERLWLLEQIGGVGSAYHLPAAVRLSGVLDVQALERAFATLVERHEGLRTRFAVLDGSPVQVIDPAGSFVLAVENLSELSEDERTSATRQRIQALAQQRFDLEQGPLFRAHLLRLSDDEHIAVVVTHHIVSDGWSTGILIREVGALYAAFSQGRPSPLDALPVQYADYALWQRDWLQGEVLARQVGYWKARLSGAPAALDLPTDRVRPAVQSFKGAAHGFTLPAELTRGLSELARREGATLFIVLLAAFQIVLSRWSGQADIVVGSPIAGRTHRELEGLIGFFVNVLPLRTNLDGDPSFGELLQRVKETALGAYAHQDLPFEKLVAELQPVRDLSRQPVFQVLFALQNVPRETLQLPGLELRRLGDGRPTAKFDLALYVNERESWLDGYFEYAADLFDQSTVERFAEHLKTLLKGIVSAPQARLSELPVLSEAERRRLLVEWNDTAAAYPRDKCLHELFGQQSGKTPDAIALAYEDSALSYGELDRHANQLAHYLRGLGVGPETIVGLCVERSLEMVVGLLGILKAGGAYLPLDPNYPAERLSYMMSNARASVIVTQAGLVDRLPEDEARVVLLDSDWNKVEGQLVTAPLNTTLPDNLAYVIYTSGSTGQPRGVMVRHRGVVSYFTFLIQTYGLGPDETVLHVSSISFDPSIRDLLGPLLSGGRLVILHGRDERNPLGYVDAIQKNSVTTLLSITPSLLGSIVDSCHGGRFATDSLRQVLTCGEALHYPLCTAVGGLFGRARLVNQYGPTECTMSSSYYRVTEIPEANGMVPIGRPINKEVFRCHRNPTIGRN